ncbi:MAG: hypothetical protein HC806_04580, partial [Anaerolineae bacterium]|nr:hypothetical protein [Anaerolineae bacterium]
YGENDQIVYQSGVYSETGGVLIQDADLAWFGTWQGVSSAWGSTLGVDPNTFHFHLALNNEIQFDNRIPPRGFNNAAFLSENIAPVGVVYADGQHWADVQYSLPTGVTRILIELKYQVASRDYIEFLKDANFTNSAGQTLYSLWENTGMSPPVVMANLQKLTGASIFLPIVNQNP